MKAIKFTTQRIKALKHTGKREDVRAIGEEGFVIRLGEKKGKAWCTIYRKDVLLANGRTKSRPYRMTHGKFPAMSLAEARAVYAATKLRVDHGEHPALERRRDAAQEKAAAILQAVEGDDTLGDLVSLYERLKAPEIKSGSEQVRMLRKDVIPRIGRVPVKQLSRRSITAVINEISLRAAVSAHKTLASLRRVLEFGVEQGWLDANPAAGAKALQKEKARARTLTDSELVAVWAGTGHPLHLFALRWALATGCRKGEILAAEWSHFQDGAWLVPESKNGAEVVRPMSTLMRELLDGVPRMSPRWVLPAVRGDGHVHAASLNVTLYGIQEASGTSGYTIHDLRRTARTRWAEMRIPHDVAEALLGHKIKGVAGVYDRWHRFPEKADTLERWGQKLLTIVEPQPAQILSM